MSPSAGRWLAAAPAVGLVVFGGTVARCAALVEEHQRYPHLGGQRPMISMLGVFEPERWVMTGGFTVVALCLGAALARLYVVHRRHEAFARPGLRGGLRGAMGLGAVAVSAFLVMSWVPLSPTDPGQSALHFTAAIATFVAVFATGIVYASVASAARRQDPPPPAPGRLAIALVYGCAVGIVGGVLGWIGAGSALAQYVAVAACFGQFLPLTPTLATPR